MKGKNKTHFCPRPRDDARRGTSVQGQPTAGSSRCPQKGKGYLDTFFPKKLFKVGRIRDTGAPRQVPRFGEQKKDPNEGVPGGRRGSRAKTGKQNNQSTMRVGWSESGPDAEKFNRSGPSSAAAKWKRFLRQSRSNKEKREKRGGQATAVSSLQSLG